MKKIKLKKKRKTKRRKPGDNLLLAKYPAERVVFQRRSRTENDLQEL